LAHGGVFGEQVGANTFVAFTAATDMTFLMGAGR
jgi:hypothetical protein